MPKSVPKQKPLATKKKKLPMSILGLLGLALVLVGIVAAIGLMQIDQDARSLANEESLEQMDPGKVGDKPGSEIVEATRQSAGLDAPKDFRVTFGDKKANGMRKVRVSWKQKNGRTSDTQYVINADRLNATCSEQQDLITNPERGPDGWYCPLAESKGDRTKRVPAGSCSKGGSCTAEIILKRGVNYDIWVAGYPSYVRSENKRVFVN